MNGILIVDKPEGVTSAAVVHEVKRRIGAKVGHLGTLDPFATGVLPLCVAEATKIAQFLNTADKTYEGSIALGSATDTGDCTGKVTQTAGVPVASESELRRIERSFIGVRTQIPPMFSAVKHGGVPLYKLARSGVEVERKGRHVQIKSLRLRQTADDKLWFEVSCSKGTYVRVLAEQIGRELGSAAHLATLRRTRFGSFGLEHAVDWQANETTLRNSIIPIRAALSHLPAVRVDAQAAEGVTKGQVRALGRIRFPKDVETVVLEDPAGEAIAVVTRHGERWRFARVLTGAPALQGIAPVLTKSAK